MAKRTALSIAVGLLGVAAWALCGLEGVAGAMRPSGLPGGTPCHAAGLEILVVDAETGTVLSTRRETSDAIGPTKLGEWRPLMLDPRFEVPPGYVSWDPRPVSIRVAPSATSLRLVHPLRRELVLRGRVEEFDRGVPRGARLASATVGGRGARDPVASIEVDGRFVVRGIPFLREEIVSLAMAVDDPSVTIECDYGEDEEHPNPVHPACRTAFWLGFAPADPGLPIEARLRFPSLSRASTIRRVLVDRGRVRRTTCCGGGVWGNVTPPPTGILQVNGVLRDGRLAHGVRVIVRTLPKRATFPETVELTLDESGRATTAELGEGPCVIRFAEAGIVSSPIEVDVTAGVETVCALVEGKGGEIDVDVVDFRGRTLPFATLDVSPEWIDVEDGVQRVDFFTDHLGHRALRHVSPGPVTIRATWGSRSGKVTVESVEGRYTPARIVLADGE